MLHYHHHRFHHHLFHRLLSSLLLSLLLLSSLPASANNDLTDLPAPRSKQPQSQSIAATKSREFLSDPATGDPLQIAMDYLHANKFALGLTDDDLLDVVLKDRYVSQNNGITHLYLRQRLNGIELFNGDININIMPDGRILNLGNRFLGDLRGRVKQSRPRLDAVSTLRSVAGQLNLSVTQALVATSSARGVDQAVEVSSGGFSVVPIPMHLIYQPLDRGQVQLAWNMTIQPINSSDWLDIRADAATGKILSQVNWTSDANAHAQESASAPITEKVAELPSAGVASNSYLVYPLPFESPFDGNQTMVNNPADGTASPYGWHDTNGVAGAEFTTTQGNNAFTYADLVAPDGFGAGDFTTEGGASLNFTYTADLNQLPSVNRDAAITNLFYVTNRVHDILYHYGFDEASGNFQANNYGNGGQGNDYVKAEAQDYSGTTNANFATPPDGLLPRMQMYLGGIALTLNVTAPNAISGIKAAGGADFGPRQFSISGDALLVDDGSATTSDGCQSPFSNAAALNGKIALIDRGNCSFANKVFNAQENGAIAAIIVDNAPGAPVGMAGSDPNITIPSAMISQADGDDIKAELGSSTVTVSMSGAQRDGSLDNGVIIHEYGHGVSNRLTGGPSNASCLDALESGGMGEGWSDFLALVLTAKSSNTATTSIPVGRWLFGQPSSGAGFRRYPYTTDMNANPLTFDSTSLSDEVHDVGEIWASMLWEVYWNLVEDHGFDADLIQGSSGNNLALQLVLDGMKLQPCAPNFVEARDAILSADLANTNGVNQCRIWEGFAKRGLGYSADAGSSSDAQDGTEAFDLPDSCMVDVQPTVLDACIPNDAIFDIALGDSFNGAATLSVNGTPAGASATFTPGTITAPTHANLTIGNTGVVTPDVYLLNVTGTGSTQIHTTTVLLNLASASPASVVLVSPPDASSDISDFPFFEWEAAPQASRYLFEIATDDAFTSLIYTETVTTNSTWLPFFLRSARTYYWRVTAQNGCGASEAASASFTVRIFPTVLIVDDDSDGGAFDMGGYFEYALTQLNVDYDYWDTGDSGTNEPTRLDDIADYSTIIWFDGYFGAGPEPATEPLLAQFLDEGKCFYISAHDYYYTRGLTPFMHDYLGVEAATDDLSDGMSWHSVITGTAPIFDGLGPYTMLYPTDNYSDLITPTVSAGVAFVGNAGNAGVYKDAGNYRTTYWGFEYENLPTDQALVETMGRVLDFCNFQTDLGIQQAVAPQGTVRPGQPITYTLTYSNSGVATAQGVLISATLPTQLANLNVVSQGAVITPVLAAPYQWQVEDLAPGQTGMITVTGVVSSQLTSDAFLRFQAAIGGDSFDSSSVNNSTTILTDTVIVPRIQLTSGATTVSEGSGTIPITVTLDQANPYSPAQVRLTSSDGSAQSGSDYQTLNAIITVPAGAVTASVPLTINEDSEIELTEMLHLNLSNPTGAALGVQQSGLITITDNDLPLLRFVDAEFNGAESIGTALIEVALDRPNPHYTVTVDYVTSDGSAVGGLDYASASGQLIFPGGSTTSTFTISIADDGIIEDAETLLLTLSNAENALLGTPATATLTIRDHDIPLAAFVNANVTKSEDAGVAAIAVELDQPSLTNVVSVTYSTIDKSATAGSDYVATSGVLTFPVGATTGNILIPILDDSDVEQSEDIQINLLGATNGLIGTPLEAIVTITDNDIPVVNFVSTTHTTSEASGIYTVTLELDRPQPFQTVSVGIQSSDGTALAGSDYDAANGVVTFPAGKTSASFGVNILDDSVVELDKSFSLTLSNPNGVTLGTLTSASIVITDSDLPSVRFASAQYSATEESGVVSATLLLDQPNPREDVVVGYITQDDSALAGSDYNPLTATVTIPKGQVSAAIKVTLIDDTAVEADEQFYLKQLSQQGASAGLPISTVITIVDGDLVPTSMLLGAVGADIPSGSTIYVGDEINFSLTISNSGGPANSVVVTVTVPNNTIYLTGSSTPGPEIVPGAGLSRMGQEQKLVWHAPTITSDTPYSLTYGLRIVAVSESLQSGVIATEDGQPVIINDPVSYSVEEERQIYLPLVNK